VQAHNVSLMTALMQFKRVIGHYCEGRETIWTEGGHLIDSLRSFMRQSALLTEYDTAELNHMNRRLRFVRLTQVRAYLNEWSWLALQEC